jgi:CRP-like cAMP-binding protein
MPIDGQTAIRRLAIITPGVVFGEMALLDAQPRSADAIADQPSVLKALSRTNFEKLRGEQPSLFAKMMQNIAHEMSLRLRTTNQQLRALED